MPPKHVGAGAFKRACLWLLKEVAEAKTEVIITKRGRPVARLVPMTSDQDRENQILRALRRKGKTIVSENEFIRRSSDDEGWFVLGADV